MIVKSGGEAPPNEDRRKEQQETGKPSSVSFCIINIFYINNSAKIELGPARRIEQRERSERAKSR